MPPHHHHNESKNSSHSAGMSIPDHTSCIAVVGSPLRGACLGFRVHPKIDTQTHPAHGLQCSLSPQPYTPRPSTLGTEPLNPRTLILPSTLSTKPRISRIRRKPPDARSKLSATKEAEKGQECWGEVTCQGGLGFRALWHL